MCILIRNLIRRQRGLEALQAVMIVGVAIFILLGLRQMWRNSIEPAVRDGVARIVNPNYIAGGSGHTAATGSPTAAGSSAPALPNGVTQLDSNTFQTNPESFGLTGAWHSPTATEASQNLAAIQQAVANSPFGIAIVGGDHLGGPTALPWTGSYDHVAVAYMGDDHQIHILEMMPSGSNLGSPNLTTGTPTQFAGNYNSVQAVSLAGVTPEQAAQFLQAMQQNTAADQTYSFVAEGSWLTELPFIDQGEICSTAILDALHQIGVGTNVIGTTGGINDVRPETILEIVRHLGGKPKKDI